MYQLAITRDFIAQHHLVGGDWGRENRLHSHHYRCEIRVEGATLDRHGYLIDIVELNGAVEFNEDYALNGDDVFGRTIDALLPDPVAAVA